MRAPKRSQAQFKAKSKAGSLTLGTDSEPTRSAPLIAARLKEAPGKGANGKGFDASAGVAGSGRVGFFFGAAPAGASGEVSRSSSDSETGDPSDDEGVGNEGSEEEEEEEGAEEEEEEEGDDFDDGEDLLADAILKGGKLSASDEDVDEDEDDDVEDEDEDVGRVNSNQHAGPRSPKDQHIKATKAPPTPLGKTPKTKTASGSTLKPSSSTLKLAGSTVAPLPGRKVKAIQPAAAVQPLTEEQATALEHDGPELLSLLENLKDGLTEVRQRMGPVLKDVSAGQLETNEGVSYLEAKHLLLLQYCSHLVFFVLLKAEGRSLEGHPVIQRLVEQRAYLEKVRPIDKMLTHQVDRLLKAAQSTRAGANKGAAADEDGDGDDTKGRATASHGADDDDDAMRYGPNPDQLVAKKGGVSGTAEAEVAGDRGTGLGSGPGVYRPPKINPVSMETGESLPEVSRNDRRKLQEQRRKATHSSLLRELAEEVAGAPSERRLEVAGQDSLAASRARQRMEARAAAEEEMMIRVPMSKDEMKKIKAQKRTAMSGAAMMDDFGSEVADIVKASRSQDEMRGNGYGSDDDGDARPRGFGGDKGKKRGGGKFGGNKKRR